MRKFIRDLLIILVVFGVLYLTGLHTDVIAFAQRIILSTGFIAPNELKESEQSKADFGLKLRSLQSEKIIDLSDYQGKVIFLNFWASWCGPCIAEMPGIQNLYSKSDTTRIKFLMVSLDSDPQKGIDFINKRGFIFPTYYPASPLPSMYDPPGIPTTFVIDPNGIVVSKTVGMANYNKGSFIEYLKQLSNSQ